MPHPQSLLAELRALEARRAQGSLSPAEEARLLELQAVSGAAPLPHGFDVNAAAAAIRDSLHPAGAARLPPVPLPPPQPDVGALGPRTPPPESAPAAPEALPPAPEDDLAPPPGIEAGAPEGYDLVAPSPAAPQDQPATQEYDVVPAFEASSAPPQWDPSAPWDPGAAAGWDADAAARGEVAAAPEPEAGPGEAWPPAAEEVLEPGAPQKPDHDTASWDLSGGAGPAMVVPDEGDPGATAVWSVGQAAEVAAAPLASQLPEGWAPDVEPAFLDELHLESDGSFALPSGAAPAEPPAADLLAAQPLEAAPEPAPEPGAPALEPVEVSDDQILEVGDSVAELPDDIPTLEGVEVEEVEPEPAPAAAGAAPPPAEPAPPVPWVSAADADLTAPEPGLPPGAEIPPPEPEPPAPAVEPEPPAPAAFAVPAPPPPPAFAAPAPPPPPAFAPPAPPAAEERAGGPAPEGEPVPLESLTIDEAPLEEEAPAPVPPPRAEPAAVPPPPAAPAAPPASAAPAAPRQRIVSGLHRVVVHTVEGQVKRGSLSDPDLEAGELMLSPQPAGATEALPAERVRAIFFMLGAGEKPPAPEGMKVRVTFRDGRQVAGFSPDYDPRANGFFMIPADTRTNTARIWVYRSAVRQVSVS